MLAGVVIAMVWFYVMGLVLLISAEANQVVHSLSDPEDMAERRAQAEQEGREDFHPGEELRSRRRCRGFGHLQRLSFARLSCAMHAFSSRGRMPCTASGWTLQDHWSGAS